MAALKKAHKRGDLQQQKFIISKFRRPDIPNQGVAGPCSPQRLCGRQGGESFPPPSSPGGPGIPGLWPHHSCLCSILMWSLLSSLHVSSMSLIRTLTIGFRAHLGNPGRFHLETLNLVTSIKIPPPTHINHRSQVDKRFGGHHSIHDTFCSNKGPCSRLAGFAGCLSFLGSQGLMSCPLSPTGQSAPFPPTFYLHLCAPTCPK